MSDEQRWMRAAKVADLDAPPSCATLELDDESFIVVNDGGTLRAFYNVCQHRGMQLCRPGRRTLGAGGRLRCPYHGWTYELDGTLAHVPELASFDGLEREELGLEPVPCEERDGFIWLRLHREVAGR
jgi:Rieske 2Fe-2S family protein